MEKSSMYSSAPESPLVSVSTFVTSINLSTAYTDLSASRSSSVPPFAPTISFSCQTQFSTSKQCLNSEIEFQQTPKPLQSKKRYHICTTCTVASCPSPADISYYNFPKDPTLLRNWVKSCKSLIQKIWHLEQSFQPRLL